MSFEPLVSVVVPIYNMGESITHCVMSIIAQSYQNYEVILVDDGSTDNSLRICKDLSGRDNRIKVFHTENRGSGPARNFGIDQAKGEYICFPDADDELTPDAFEKMVMATEEGKHDLVIAGFELVDQEGEHQKTQHYQNEAHSGDSIRRSYSRFVGSKSHCPINGAPWIKLFDLKIIRQFGIEYPPLRRHQDTAFIVRYLSYTNSVFFLDAVLYKHYTNDIRLVWEKYPTDYMEVCYELNRIMVETVLTWNPEDSETRDLVNVAYITRTVKAIELTYSKKQNLNSVKRLQWLRNTNEKYGLDKMRIPTGLDHYHKTVFKLLSRRQFSVVLLICGLKVLVERKGRLSAIKSVVKGA